MKLYQQSGASTCIFLIMIERCFQRGTISVHVSEKLRPEFFY